MSCDNSIIGRASQRYRSPACRRRAHRRGHSKSVTPSPAANGGARPTKARREVRIRCRAVPSLEAKALLASLDEQLQEWAEEHAELGLGVDDVYDWSVQDRMHLQPIARVVDRNVDLWARYQGTDETGLRKDLSSELRQLEKLLADLLQRVRATLPPKPPSRTSQKASAAQRQRWEQEHARNQARS
ncbi:hypothetical protein [Mycobacterium intracellulare]|uniref:hypothetical protein n=1 Tax=Mycobacterium intracellulare TaxID=1767 RepID=UPI00109E78B7|nr:hypothetical protein [Mycobacterium intracellulare]